MGTRKKTRTKVISLLLTLVLATALVPSGAFAFDSTSGQEGRASDPVAVVSDEPSENGGSTPSSLSKSSSSTAVQVETSESEVENPEVPTFLTNIPEEAVYSYCVGNAADELKVEASTKDAGSLIYQWYSAEGEEAINLLASSVDVEQIDGIEKISLATEMTFAPPTDNPGTRYYFVVATNSFAEKSVKAISRIATVTVVEEELDNFDATPADATTLAPLARNLQARTVDQVRVIVENNTYSAAGGAPWEGVLVDTWVPLNADSTMMTCVVAALDAKGYSQEGAENNYIETINGLSEFDGGNMSGWMGTLNDWFTNQGFAAYTVTDGSLQAGDEIHIMYTSNGYGEDLGASWNNNNKSLKALTASIGNLSPEFASDTYQYDLTIPANVEGVVVTPTATNKNFQVRTSVGGTEYKRTATIPVLDGTKITIVCGDDAWPSMNGASDVPKTTYEITVREEQPSTVSATVTMGMQQENCFVLTPSSYEVPSDLAEKYGYTDTVAKSESVSALDVLVKSHELLFEDSFTAADCQTYLAVNASGSISTVMGEETYAFSFAINGDYPHDPNGAYNEGFTGYTINQAPVSDGDSIDFFFYGDPWYSDYYTWFERNGSKVSSVSIEKGVNLELSLQGLMYAFGGYLNQEDRVEQGVLSAIEDAQLVTIDTKTQEASLLSGAVTDENGFATISFSKPGTYYVSANIDPDETYTYITSPWLIVEVTNSAPQRKPSVEATANATVEKGSLYTLELSSIFEDVDGDAISYLVSVDGAPETTAAGSYSFTPSSIGNTTLVFKASDGTAVSTDTYTVALSTEQARAHLASLIVHSSMSPSNSTVLLRNLTDKYTTSAVFDPAIETYDLGSVNNMTELRFRAKSAETGDTVKIVYGEGESEKDITWTSGSSKWANCLTLGKNTLQVVVTPSGDSEKAATSYTLSLDNYATLSALALNTGSTPLYLDKQFSGTDYNYSVNVPQDATTLDVAATAPANSSLLYNDSASSSVDISGKDEVVIDVIGGSGANALTTTYHLSLVRVPATTLTMNVYPEDAIVQVVDPQGVVLRATEDGTFSDMFSLGGYTYVITKYGYVAKRGDVPTTGGSIDVILQAAADDGLEDVGSAWDSFRGNSNNMGTTDVETPITSEDIELKWSRKLGSGWTAAPSVQIIVDNALVVMSGTTIYKLDLQSGETLAQGTMVASPSYGYTPPLYAEGMIFAPLGGGRIQAFNAKTLESLWVYTDALKGQALSPLTYSEGYLYTGFWNSETKAANYICISITDEDVTRGDEAKTGSWVFKNTGGFYWAGSLATEGAIIVGTDDGTSQANGASKIYALDKHSGMVVSELDIVGDQRSTIAYDASRERIYFTTKAGWLYSAKVDATTGALSDLKGLDVNAQSTSTPVVYKNRVYFGTGSGISSTGSNGNIAVADADTLKMLFAVGMKGYPQCSVLLSNAYEADTGYIYLYSTYNSNPGGISMIKAKVNCSTEDDVELIEIYDADGFAQYCIASIICGSDGTLYYKNDSGNVLAVGYTSNARITKVKTKIDAIGNVTFDSEPAITAARSAYDTLLADQKTLVDNYDVLTAAETMLAQLKEAQGSGCNEEPGEQGNSESANDGQSASAIVAGSPTGVTRSAGVVSTAGVVAAAVEPTGSADNNVKSTTAAYTRPLPSNAAESTDGNATNTLFPWMWIILAGIGVIALVTAGVTMSRRKKSGEEDFIR